MTRKFSDFQKFWQELKRRKVFKVVAMYAGTAFIILQLVDIIAQPLQLPAWTMTLVIVLLCIGFIIALLISWIYDITPEGIKKTESIETVKKRKSRLVPVKRGFKASDIIIAAMAVVIVILLYPKVFKRDKLEKIRSSGQISVAVMPFQNMTNDTTWNIWQNGIQNELITSLTNSEELKVRQTESINGLIQSKGLTNYASITPSVASTLSQKLDANVFIYGSIKQAGSTIRLNAHLVDSKTEEAYKSFQIDGIAENILQLTDSLSGMVNNFLIISILKKEVSPAFYQFLGSTKSPDALRNFISGQKAFSRSDFPAAIKFYLRSIAADSNFFFPYIQIFWAYRNQGLTEQPVNVLTQESNKWCLRIYEKKDLMSIPQKNLADWIYAVCFGSPYEAIKYLRQTLEFDDQSPDVYSDIGTTYQLLHQYDKAIPEYEKALGIYNKWGVKPFWSKNYTRLGNAYHLTGQYKKERLLYKKAEQDFPDNPDIIDGQSILSFTEGDTVAGNRYLEKSISIRKDNSESAANIATSVASIFSLAGILDKAEENFRQALSFEPDNTLRINDLAYFLIDNDRNIDEGLELTTKALELSPDNVVSLDYKGWGLYKKGRYEEALKALEKGWNLRHRYSIYFHIDEVKKAIAKRKNN